MMMTHFLNQINKGELNTQSGMRDIAGEDNNICRRRIKHHERKDGQGERYT